MHAIAAFVVMFPPSMDPAMLNLSTRLHRLCFLRPKGARHRVGRRLGPAGERQRPGTNLAMQVLERSWETEMLTESDPRAFNYLSMLARLDAAWRTSPETGA